MFTSDLVTDATPANPNDVSPSPVLPDNDIRESTDLLDRDFQRRNDAWANFPPDVTPSDIRRSSEPWNIWWLRMTFTNACESGSIMSL